MNQSESKFTAIVLAAGLGKRMNSQTPKVLLKIGDKSMLLQTVEKIRAANPAQIIVVVNPTNKDLVKKELGTNCQYAVQEKQLGTADAAQIGLQKVGKDVNTIGIFYGDDTSFYDPLTFISVNNLHQTSKAKVTFITLIKDDPTGLGRIIRVGDKVTAIVEEKDASNAQKKIREISDGVWFFEKSWFEKAAKQITPSPKTGELYLTDTVKMAAEQKQKIETYTLEKNGQWHGVNTHQELILANAKHMGKVHFMGISGAGASAVAKIANTYGFELDGCDLNPDSPYSKDLKVKVLKGHSPEHLKNIKALVVSPAISIADPQNPELQNAKKRNIPILSWQKFQGEYLTANKFLIAVAGAYGKSTTTAMVSQILIDQGLDPTCEVGAKVLNWNTNFQIGKSNLYVCEADEYNNNFLNYFPNVAVVLNAAWDHPDFFKKNQDLINSYIAFVNNIKPGGTLIIQKNLLDQIKKQIRSDIKVEVISDFPQVNLSLIGNFRKENANAALQLAKVLNLNLEKARVTLKNFKGLGRRLEYKGEISGAMFFDDYAVQPYTIMTTANALKEKYPDKNLTLVLEPHTFSRIETFFNDFVKDLKNIKANEILITDVFAAREKGDSKTLSQKLAKSANAQYAGTHEDVAKKLSPKLNAQSVILSMGAGNAYKLFDLCKKIK